MDRLDVGIILERILAQLSPYTRLLEPTKRHLDLGLVGAVDLSLHRRGYGRAKKGSEDEIQGTNVRRERFSRTHMEPASRACPTRNPLSISLVNTEAARPYVVLLACSITSVHGALTPWHVTRDVLTLFGLELENARDGSKDLLPDDLHVWLTSGEDGRLDKVPFVSDTVPPGVHGCALRFAGVDVAHDALMPNR